MTISFTCGARRARTAATIGLPCSSCRPLSTPPMRRPWPPASTIPVTPLMAGFYGAGLFDDARDDDLHARGVRCDGRARAFQVAFLRRRLPGLRDAGDDHHARVAG